MKLEFKNKGNYSEWANAIWKKGYTLPINEIPGLIGVSISWIKQTLLKEIDYVVYENKWIYKKTNNKCLTYTSLDNLSKFIMDHGTYEIQTEIIDLAYVLKPFPKEMNKCISLYKISLETYKNRGYYIGTMPNPVLKYINKNFIAVGLMHNWSCKERSKVKWVEIEPFDIFEHKNRIYYCGSKQGYGCQMTPNNNTEGYVSELVYRDAFLNGDIKIKLGRQITIFYKRKQKTEGMKLPFLIPYGSEIKIYKT